MTTVTALSVTGMTCGHCVSAVTRELKDVEGVQEVSVELHVGETSSVRVISDHPVAEDALREAIDEAGYDVVGVDVLENAVAAEYAAQAPARQATHTLLPVTEALSESGTTGGGATPTPHGTPPEQRHHHEANGGESGGHSGCACGCGGQGRQGLGIGLPIVPLR